MAQEEERNPHLDDSFLFIDSRILNGDGLHLPKSIQDVKKQQQKVQKICLHFLYPPDVFLLISKDGVLMTSSFFLLLRRPS